MTCVIAARLLELTKHGYIHQETRCLTNPVSMHSSKKSPATLVNIYLLLLLDTEPNAAKRTKKTC